jgi:DNA-binding NtrC family response regulator
MSRILLVDDDAGLRRIIQFKLSKNGYTVTSAADGAEALSLLRHHQYDLILSDLKMPNLDGLELLAQVKKLQPDTQVILMTAYATVSQAVQAVKLGAFDYLTKPFDDDQLFLVLEKALKVSRLEEENRHLKDQLKGLSGGRQMAGISAKFRGMMTLIEKIAPTDATILISGESGTGKELVARTIHRLSPRRDKEFIAVNCAAIPKELLESELFGHVKGAFTGAVRDKRGRFELADGGTLLLDEVGELSLELQAKLLRVIQERLIEPIGAEKGISVDVRLLAATNINLRDKVEKDQFREDLFYRLNVIPIEVPSLRERRDDIPLLVKEFLARFAPDTAITLDKELMELLTQHSWPGNIRELENLVERMVILRNTDRLGTNDLPLDFLSKRNGTRERPSDSEPQIGFHEAEQKLILNALEKSGWNKSKAADYLHIPRHILLYRMKKYSIRQSDDSSE